MSHEEAKQASEKWVKEHMETFALTPSDLSVSDCVEGFRTGAKWDRTQVIDKLATGFTTVKAMFGNDERLAEALDVIYREIQKWE